MYYYNDADVIIYKKGGSGIMNIDGKTITEPIYSDIRYSDRSDCFIVRIGKKYGLINREGKEIIPVTFDKVGLPLPNLVSVTFGKRIGYIDGQGNYLTFTKKGLNAELRRNN